MPQKTLQAPLPPHTHWVWENTIYWSQGGGVDFWRPPRRRPGLGKCHFLNPTQIRAPPPRGFFPTPAGSMNSYGFYRIPWIPLPPAGSMNSYGFYRIPWISAPARVPLVEMLAIPGIPAFPHFSLPEATPAKGAGPIVVRPLMCWPLA